jgi:copper transport protein
MHGAFRRLLIVAAVLFAAGVQAPDALAHASLVKAEPADGAVVAAPPPAARLTFNEPVSPLALRLVGPDGAPIALGESAVENATLAVALPALKNGTHLLSWRVASADGHPVGGSLLFSVGAPSAQPPTAAVSDPAVRTALWAVKLVVYLGLFVGAGGAFFRAWIDDPASRTTQAAQLALLGAGLLAVPMSAGLQGLDALDLPLRAIWQRPVWEAGLATAYGFTVIIAECALLAALFSFAAPSGGPARALSAAGLVGAGLALALSGHASNAAPALVNRPVVFLHGLCVAFWIGSLLPLSVIVRGRDAAVGLARFSRAIPLPLTLLVGSGAWLSVVQLGRRIDALWTTSYGEILFRKLVAVFALLGLAAVNRFWLTPKLGARGTARTLRLSIALELVLALVIVALVAQWRFTPPPRSLAAATTVSLHIHGDKAMADIEFIRDSPHGMRVNLLVLDSAFRPLAAREVTLILANESAGIEPVRRPAARAGENVWLIEDVRVPVAGRWSVQVDILVSDFEKAMLVGTVALPRMP